MSDRNVTDFSLDAHMMDLDAVANGLRLDRFALLGQLNLGPAAIGYAERNPKRISSLILWCSNFRPLRSRRSPRGDAIIALMDADWDLYTEGHIRRLVFGNVLGGCRGSSSNNR